ncbi:MAG: hypothetical protein K2K63_17335 [Acetatifactor sp.]|nr:hypothetical protein [Acetatifactor sp.]
MEFQLGQFHLDIDVQKTRSFYRKSANVSESCSCPGCRNYENAAGILPDEIKCFFNSIGVDIKKPAEVYVNSAHSDGSLLYGGFYHLCGTNGFYVSFQEDCSLVEADFPAPVLQMEIEATIPWVLQETNIYI